MKRFLMGGACVVLIPSFCCTAGVVINGIPGWRLVFASVAVVSAVIGLLNFLFARDPNFTTAAGEKSERSSLPGGGLAEIGRQIWAVLTIPTFLIIVLQARVLLSQHLHSPL